VVDEKLVMKKVWWRMDVTDTLRSLMFIFTTWDKFSSPVHSSLTLNLI
jgi:hypothetical protein